ncbi:MULTISPECIES: alpha/beta-type small acid-soluble spore protein [unclassified Paenibacillus]|uniref:alpha/beta-type small acid-soluble spore protein n=1 Tax=unclassified Paenibacillus TaxID=185978 RepID=UPI0024052E0B|nr:MULTISPECIES: alpha/beta-type small acid-soluble spore protein [unclassified Paenibacillus]MDF9842494.1 small acid-soluble spore protein D (minor alpha/beta-type SASP) [Paenibacillus sp. PastF-2]MDF9849084.1 small acid-soluble spore protein D (minor alpha/beta-type SASP) [Paenibacillus sp. PastM-2]MDF9855654.1 small acid-soluble spore protein D (minor alpha/beta-type SASP) [Paenibacillus sp. PastF-1]MDH6480926.1 small acid-soluble spore protein D (minor alpha/beta-type SASP) [Paenibacillus s
MARRNRKYAVLGAAQGMQNFKADVMRREGYAVDPNHPDDVKYEVAKELGIPLQSGNNGNLTTEEAGHIGGRIGGSMVREMIRLAQEQLAEKGQS